MCCTLTTLFIQDLMNFGLHFIHSRIEFSHLCHYLNPHQQTPYIDISGTQPRTTQQQYFWIENHFNQKVMSPNWVKKANPKSNTMWFHSYNILEMTILEQWRMDYPLPKSRGVYKRATGGILVMMELFSILTLSKSIS